MNEPDVMTVLNPVKDHIKELRTRVAEAEKKIKEQNEYIEDDDSVLCQQRNEADAERRKAENQCRVLASENDIYKEKVKELQNRLSTLEGYQKTYFEKIDAERVVKIIELEKRLSTLRSIFWNGRHH